MTTLFNFFIFSIKQTFVKMPDGIGAPAQKPQEYEKPQTFISESVKNLTVKDPSFVESCVAFSYYRPIPSVDRIDKNKPTRVVQFYFR